MMIMMMMMMMMMMIIIIITMMMTPTKQAANLPTRQYISTTLDISRTTKSTFFLNKEAYNLQTYTAPGSTEVNHVKENERGYLNHSGNWNIWTNGITSYLVGTECVRAELSVLA